MHIHILGICGTFMGGLALLARQKGFEVSGCDSNFYPPMSDQLKENEIKIVSGWGKNQTKLNPDMYIIGNVISRGNPIVEEILNKRLKFMSGPEWLSKNILNEKFVIGVAGTHGKTTTSSMISWILEENNIKPSFLIGGVPKNFNCSARLTDSKFFVIEADEYDTAFFDKRSKFMHYKPNTVVLNNLEFDHADIFNNIKDIETQFQFFLRTISSNSLVIANKKEKRLRKIIDKDCWSKVDYFCSKNHWYFKKIKNKFFVKKDKKTLGALPASIIGEHNRNNALAALIACQNIGVNFNKGLKALNTFDGVKRRMELICKHKKIEIFSDFAHHPTAIKKTIDGIKENLPKNRRIVVIFEPRSNTMMMRKFPGRLDNALMDAQIIFCYKNNIKWDVKEELKGLGKKLFVYANIKKLVNKVVDIISDDDLIVIMSNGSFGGIFEKLCEKIKSGER